MPRTLSRHQLYRLRNEIPIHVLIRDVCQWPSKHSEGYFRFLCPRCQDMHTATNPATNLARCFRCQKNFNPIDWVMEVRNCDFLQATTFLAPLLDSTDTQSPSFHCPRPHMPGPQNQIT